MYATESEDKQTYLTYNNYTWGTSIQYPSTWYREEGGYYFSDLPGVSSKCFPNIVSFAPTSSNLDNSTDAISLRLNLISNFIPSLFGENQTLEGHVRTTFDLYGIQDWIPVFWPVHLDFNSTLAGLQAYKLIYYKDGGKYQVMEIGTIANNDIYQINYSSTPGKFSENLLTVQHMINSLKIGRPHSVPDLIKSSEDISFDFKSDPSFVHIVDDIAHEECAGPQ